MSTKKHAFRILLCFTELERAPCDRKWKDRSAYAYKEKSPSPSSDVAKNELGDDNDVVENEDSVALTNKSKSQPMVDRPTVLIHNILREVRLPDQTLEAATDEEGRDTIKCG